MPSPWWSAARPLCASTITDYPITVENYIDQGNPNSNYQSLMSLNVNGSNDGKYSNTVTRALIQLPTAALTALSSTPAADVTDATVNLDLTAQTGLTNPTSPAQGISLYPLTQGFNTTTVTWNNSGGGAFESTGPFWSPGSGALSPSKTSPVLCSWDITSLLSDSNLLSNGAILMFDESLAQTIVPPTSFFMVKFWGGSPSPSYPACQQGYVEITTVPEPSTMALLAAGASLAAIGFGRRWTARRRVLGTS